MSKILNHSFPSGAKRVFKGVIFDIYQWQQKMFDGSIATFERIKRPDTMEIVATVGDKIVLQHQKQPHTGQFLSLPGGRIDAGEDALNGAKRELLEETGYVSDDWHLLKQLKPHSHVVFTIYTYIARNCRKESGPTLEAGERITCRLIDFDRLLELSESEDFLHRDFRLFLALCRLDEKRKEKFRKLLFSESVEL